MGKTHCKLLISMAEPLAPFQNWDDVLFSIPPYAWAGLGTSMAIGLSVLGAAWGIFITGSSLVGAAIKAPRIRSKNLISVIFCEAVAIYGVIMAIIMETKVSAPKVEENKEIKYYEFLFAAYAIISSGFGVG